MANFRYLRSPESMSIVNSTCRIVYVKLHKLLNDLWRPEDLLWSRANSKHPTRHLKLPTRPRGRSGGRLPALDLDLPKINHPYFSKSASWLQSRGFSAVCPTSTVHPPITSYIYIPLFTLFYVICTIYLFYLYIRWLGGQIVRIN